MTGIDSNLDPAYKRRFPRYAVDLRVDVGVFRSGKNLSLWGRSTELSEDGIGATLTSELEPGEVVWIELTLPPPDRPVKMRALVRYRDGLRHGLEFLARNPEQQDVLHRICEGLASRK
jgi:PilZ domain